MDELIIGKFKIGLGKVLQGLVKRTVSTVEIAGIDKAGEVKL